MWVVVEPQEHSITNRWSKGWEQRGKVADLLWDKYSKYPFYFHSGFIKCYKKISSFALTTSSTPSIWRQYRTLPGQHGIKSLLMSTSSSLQLHLRQRQNWVRVAAIRKRFIAKALMFLQSSPWKEFWRIRHVCHLRLWSDTTPGVNDYYQVAPCHSMISICTWSILNIHLRT